MMGLPAVGKSTVSRELCCRLQKLSKKSILVDADALAEYSIMPLPNEFGLDARMKRAEMMTNVLRWLTPQFEYIVVAASGQPASARELFKKELKKLYTVYLRAPAYLRKYRDYKGIYKKKNVIGLDLPFDEPLDSDMIIDIENSSPSEITEKILKSLGI